MSLALNNWTLLYLDRALFTSQEAIEDDPLEGAETLKKVAEIRKLFVTKNPDNFRLSYCY